MKVLITGASGFIGSYLVKEALARGYEVWAGVRATSSLERLPQEKIHCIDLCYHDSEKLTEQLRAHISIHGAWDFVIHNAGITKALHMSDFFEVNAENTRRLLESLTAADGCPKKFLLMSSLSTYGKGDEKTFRPIRLNDPQVPDTIYGKSKLLAENYVCKQKSFPYIIMRPTGVYGPGDKDYGMAVESIRSGFDFKVGKIPQRLTFIYVKDLAKAVFLALENNSIINRHYFVADGDVYTDTQFARLTQELLSKKRVFHARIPLWLTYLVCFCSEKTGRLRNKPMTLNTDKYKILKQRNWICDVEPLRNELGFEPSYDLRRGLKELIRLDFSS